MQRHTITFLCWLSFISCLLLFTDLNKVLASETPPAITPTPAPTDAISYELICEESRPEGCPADTSNLSISWLVECGGACSPKRECNFVRHVNGIPDPTITVTPTLTAMPTATPSFLNCGQSIGMDWRASTIGCSGSQTYYYTYWEDGAWRNCAFRSASRRLISLRVALTLGDTSDLHTINNFNIGWQGDQGYGFDVIFYRCHSSSTNTCQSSANLTYTRASKSDLVTNPIPSVDFVYGVTINFHNVDVGAISETTADGVRNMIVLDDISFCSSKLIFAPTTPTPTPTPEPQQPTCTTDVERLFRVASVESCDVDDDLVLGWRNYEWDVITLEVIDIPEWQGCFAKSLAYREEFYTVGKPFAVVAELSHEVWLSEVRIHAEPIYSNMIDLEWSSMLILLYLDGQVVYELDYNHEGIHHEDYIISVPNVRADAVGVSIPVISGENPAIQETRLELFFLEAYGSFDLPICGAGGVAPNDCQDPRLMETGYDVPSLEMKQTSRFCRTIIRSFFDFKGIQACFSVYELPTLNLLGFSVSLTMLFHAIVAGYILRNILTR
jgi:hypothetical protein